MSRPANTFIDFDGTLVLENSSRVLMEALMERAATRPERWLARLLRGPLQRAMRLALEIVGRITGDRDLVLVLVLWAFKLTFVANRDEIVADVARQLTLNVSLTQVYRRPFAIASAGLRPIIEAFLALHPELPAVAIYASDLAMDGSKLNLKLLTLRGKLRTLREYQADSYYTDYDREAKLFSRLQPGDYATNVVPGGHDNTIFHLEDAAMKRWRTWLAAGLVVALAAFWMVATTLDPDLMYTLGAPAGGTVAASSGYGFSTGLTTLSPADLDQRLAVMKATGVTWVRYDVSWANVQPDSAKTYDWSDYDRVTKAARAHGFTVLMIIDFAPQWAAAKGCQDGQLCAPANPAAYAKFAAAVAKRYKADGVSDFEIWNEPNINFRFEPGGNPALYVRMLKDSYAAIKRVDSKAVVITGGTSPSGTSGGNYSPQDFVAALYADGAGGWFNAVAAHPYTSPLSPAQSTPLDAWGQLTAVHNIMAAHGDGSKQIWITEYGAPTNGPDPAGFVSEDFQAQIATDAVGIWHSYSWAGPMFWYDFQDDGVTTDTNENFYGLVRADGSHKPAYDAFVQAISTP